VMWSYLIRAWVLLIVAGISVKAAPRGFIEGHLKILSNRPVELADENVATLTQRNYADYPLVILSRGERKQIARISADADGNYRAALPPGDYILDAEGRVPKRLQVRAQQFKVVPNETVHVDMTIITGFAAEANTPQE